MDFFIDIFLHIDQHLITLVQEYHEWTYALLFLIIFCETGLVVTPFLPGDSLLFVSGAVASLPGMPLEISLLPIVVPFNREATQRYGAGLVKNKIHNRNLKDFRAIYQSDPFSYSKSYYDAHF